MAVSPPLVDVPVPAVPSPQGSTVTGLGLDHSFYADINMTSDHFVGHIADLPQPYPKWPALTTSMSVDGPVALGDCEGLDRGDLGLMSPGTSSEEQGNLGDVRTASFCSSPEISDLMLADLCVDYTNTCLQTIKLIVLTKQNQSFKG